MLKLVLIALQAGGGLALLIALAVKGPTRAVKILAAAYMVLLGVGMAAIVSPGTALRVVFFSVLFGALLSTLALLSWRVQIERTLDPIDASAFPPHSWNEIRRRGEEATAAGLHWIGDRSYAFRIALQEGRGFQRFFATPDRTRWAYVHALSSGRLVVAYVSGLTSSGRCLRVAGGMDDFSLHPTPMVAVRTVPAKMPLAEMLAAHEAFCREQGETVVPTPDPIATHAQIHDRWISDLVASGTLKRQGNVARPTLRSIPGCLMRQAADWLR